MGTPGDKTKFGKVVPGDSSQLDPEQSEEQTAKPPQTSDTVDPSQYPSTSTSEMGVYRGVYSRLPQFESFSAYNINPSLPQATEKVEQLPLVATSLGQATIEDYFVQSKYYPSLSETLYYSTPPQKVEKPKTFPSLDEPGPSGLQTPRTRTPQPKVKRSRKSQQLPQQTPKKPFECSVCQKCFINAAKLAKHQHIHGGSSPYRCEHCKKSFSSRFKLVRHALIHSDRKPFSCQVCERTFHRKDHLKNHIKVHSPSKKVYICEKPDCKKEYTSLLSYRKHLALHSAEEGSLECQICFDTFQTKEEILYHLKIHAGSRTVKNPNEKKFTCEHCGRKFFTKKDVRRHLVVHTGMRDFLCQFCPQTFGRKDHLVRHIKKSHAKNLPPEAQTELETTISVKSEQPESYVKTETSFVKAEPSSSYVKAESESSLSNPEQYAPLEFSIESFSESSLIFGQEFEQLNPMLPQQGVEHLQYLPSTSTQASSTISSSFLEELAEGTSESMLPEIISQENLPNPEDINPQLLDETVLIHDSEIIRLLQTSEDKNLPLPGFSQTFQSPPPPP